LVEGGPTVHGLANLSWVKGETPVLLCGLKGIRRFNSRKKEVRMTEISPRDRSLFSSSEQVCHGRNDNDRRAISHIGPFQAREKGKAGVKRSDLRVKNTE